MDDDDLNDWLSNEDFIKEDNQNSLNFELTQTVNNFEGRVSL